MPHGTRKCKAGKTLIGSHCKDSTSEELPSAPPGTAEALVAGQPVVLATSSFGGRGVFAARDFAASELVLAARVNSISVDQRCRADVCHGCLSLKSTNHVACDDDDDGAFAFCLECETVAYCSQSCAANDQTRHSYECDALKRLEQKRLPKDEAKLARLLCGLAADAMMEAESASLNSALCLARDSEDAPQFKRRQRQRRAAVSAFVSATEGTPLSKLRVDQSEMEAALAGVPMTEFGLTNASDQACGTTVCDVVAMTNHSCTPNVARRFEGREIRLYALHSITSGSEILHSYIGRDMEAEERSIALKNTWCIDCRCVRCGGTNPSPSGSEATIEDFDLRFGCICGAFRIEDAPKGACWCLAKQLKRNS